MRPHRAALVLPGEMTPEESRALEVATHPFGCQRFRGHKRPFAITPLLDLMQPATDDGNTWDRLGLLALRLSSSLGSATAVRRQVYRWRKTGLTINEADQIAVAMSLHPSLIWPEWYEVEDEMVSA